MQLSSGKVLRVVVGYDITQNIVLFFAGCAITEPALSIILLERHFWYCLLGCLMVVFLMEPFSC